MPPLIDKPLFQAPVGCRFTVLTMRAIRLQLIRRLFPEWHEIRETNSSNPPNA